MTASAIKSSSVQKTIFSLKPGPRPERIDIGDGLIMRWSTKADADNVGALLAEAFKVRTEIENVVFGFKCMGRNSGNKSNPPELSLAYSGNTLDPLCPRVRSLLPMRYSGPPE